MTEPGSARSTVPLTVLDLLRERAPADSGRPFVTTPAGETLTYGDLDDTAARMVAVLRARRTAGRPRRRTGAEVPAAVVLHVALLRAGAVQLPMNPAYTDDEVAYLLGDATPVLVVHDPARPVPQGPYAALTLDDRGQGSLTARGGGGRTRPRRGAGRPRRPRRRCSTRPARPAARRARC